MAQERRGALARALMDGLSCYRPRVDPIADPKAYAAHIKLYADDLASAGVDAGALEAALRRLRLTYRRHDWPVVAEILEMVEAERAAHRPRLPRRETALDREARERREAEAARRADMARLPPGERDLQAETFGLMMHAVKLAVVDGGREGYLSYDYFRRLAEQGVTKADLPKILSERGEP